MFEYAKAFYTWNRYQISENLILMEKLIVTHLATLIMLTTLIFFLQKSINFQVISAHSYKLTKHFFPISLKMVENLSDGPNIIFLT